MRSISAESGFRRSSMVLTGQAWQSLRLRQYPTLAQGPGQADSICSWLDQWQKGDETAARWPGTISMSELESGTLGQTGPQRPSWCYGTPGIARAQQLAGLALGDQARQHQ